MPTPADTRYGFPLDEWHRAVRETREVLSAAARARSTVTYGQLCDRVTAVRVFPRSWALLALIAEASADDTFARGTEPASLVVRASDGMPGGGYFRWAERAGFDVRDRRAFWESEVRRVYEAWRGEREQR